MLSNERTRSRWAHVLVGTRAGARPDADSAEVGRLNTLTEDGTPELVLALRQVRLPGGAVWVNVRIPMRPNGVTGWVPRERIGRYHLVTTMLRINRRRKRATLERRGRRIWSARVGVGKAATPTPSGRFYARDRLRASDRSGIYGPVAIGTSAFAPNLSDWPRGGIVGIHGTNQPNLIPGNVSHGCIRVRNADIVRLAAKMPLGTPIKID